MQSSGAQHTEPDHFAIGATMAQGIQNDIDEPAIAAAVVDLERQPLLCATSQSNSAVSEGNHVTAVKGKKPSGGGGGGGDDDDMTTLICRMFVARTR
jgi:hypothetical protein